MTSEALKYYLPPVMIILTMLVIVWDWVRYRQSNKFLNKILVHQDLNLKRLMAIRKVYKFLLILSCMIVFSFSFRPDLYQWFLPIAPLDHVLINSLGVLILKVAFVWNIVVHIHADKELHRSALTGDRAVVLYWMKYSEKMLILGILLILVGVFVSISSMGAVALCVSAFSIYWLSNKSGKAMFSL